VAVLNIASIIKKRSWLSAVIQKISLLDARRKRDDARRLLANNVDPDAVRKAQKQPKLKKPKL